MADPGEMPSPLRRYLCPHERPGLGADREDPRGGGVPGDEVFVDAEFLAGKLGF